LNARDLRLSAAVGGLQDFFITPMVFAFFAEKTKKNE
jgi:hypothetical protein